MSGRCYSPEVWGVVAGAPDVPSRAARHGAYAAVSSLSADPDPRPRTHRPSAYAPHFHCRQALDPAGGVCVSPRVSGVGQQQGREAQQRQEEEDCSLPMPEVCQMVVPPALWVDPGDLELADESDSDQDVIGDSSSLAGVMDGGSLPSSSLHRDYGGVVGSAIRTDTSESLPAAPPSASPNAPHPSACLPDAAAPPPSEIQPAGGALAVVSPAVSTRRETGSCGGSVGHGQGDPNCSSSHAAAAEMAQASENGGCDGAGSCTAVVDCGGSGGSSSSACCGGGARVDGRGEVSVEGGGGDGGAGGGGGGSPAEGSSSGQPMRTLQGGRPRCSPTYRLPRSCAKDACLGSFHGGVDGGGNCAAVSWSPPRCCTQGRGHGQQQSLTRRRLEDGTSFGSPSAAGAAFPERCDDCRCCARRKVPHGSAARRVSPFAQPWTNFAQNVNLAASRAPPQPPPMKRSVGQQEEPVPQQQDCRRGGGLVFLSAPVEATARGGGPLKEQQLLPPPSPLTTPQPSASGFSAPPRPPPTPAELSPTCPRQPAVRGCLGLASSGGASCAAVSNVTVTAAAPGASAAAAGYLPPQLRPRSCGCECAVSTTRIRFCSLPTPKHWTPPPPPPPSPPPPPPLAATAACFCPACSSLSDGGTSISSGGAAAARRGGGAATTSTAFTLVHGSAFWAVQSGQVLSRSAPTGVFASDPLAVPPAVAATTRFAAAPPSLPQETQPTWAQRPPETPAPPPCRCQFCSTASAGFPAAAKTAAPPQSGPRVPYLPYLLQDHSATAAGTHESSHAAPSLPPAATAAAAAALTLSNAAAPASGQLSAYQLAQHGRQPTQLPQPQPQRLQPVPRPTQVTAGPPAAGPPAAGPPPQNSCTDERYGGGLSPGYLSPTFASLDGVGSSCPPQLPMTKQLPYSIKREPSSPSAASGFKPGPRWVSSQPQPQPGSPPPSLGRSGGGPAKRSSSGGSPAAGAAGPPASPPPALPEPVPSSGPQADERPGQERGERLTETQQHTNASSRESSAPLAPTPAASVRPRSPPGGPRSGPPGRRGVGGPGEREPAAQPAAQAAATSAAGAAPGPVEATAARGVLVYKPPPLPPLLPPPPRFAPHEHLQQPPPPLPLPSRYQQQQNQPSASSPVVPAPIPASECGRSGQTGYGPIAGFEAVTTATTAAALPVQFWCFPATPQLRAPPPGAFCPCPQCHGPPGPAPPAAAWHSTASHSSGPQPYPGNGSAAQLTRGSPTVMLVTK